MYQAIRNAHEGDVCSACEGVLLDPDHEESSGVLVERTTTRGTSVETFCLPCVPIAIDGELQN